jgi:hypothetical protein
VCTTPVSNNSEAYSYNSLPASLNDGATAHLNLPAPILDTGATARISAPNRTYPAPALSTISPAATTAQIHLGGRITVQPILPAPLLDSGATGHFIALADASTYLHSVTTEHTPITVTLPNGSTVTSIAVGYLIGYTGLPSTALMAYVFAELSASMISVGQLIDGGADVLFTATLYEIIDAHGISLATGHRYPQSGLWLLPPPPPNSHTTPHTAPLPPHTVTTSHTGPLPQPTATAGSALYLPLITQQVKWLHASYGSQPHSSMRQALQRSPVMPHQPGTLTCRGRK